MFSEQEERDTPCATDAYLCLAQYFGTQPKIILKMVQRLFTISIFENALSFECTPQLYSATIAKDNGESAWYYCLAERTKNDFEAY